MKMNRKGALQAFITQAFIIGLLIFIFVTIFGVGGGFQTAFDIGKFVAKVPVIFWVMLAIFWLFGQIRGK